ncbi:MAG: bifunctional oligoribonuclease/PAP phosphatase NrnA [Clostridia bacterium]|nr:bifunctional oligoribonuclease/PAP phosphatase NrnA [Clostridia bacterium]
MKVFEVIYNKMLECNKVAVISHKSPDGDCLGSGMALYYFFKNHNKEIDLYCDDVIHENYHFLVKGCYNQELIANDYDLVISVDCGDLKRLGKFEEFYVAHSNTINIDHHSTNNGYGKVNCVVPDISSACEVIYDIFEYNNYEIDKNIATALYSGLSTDTGCFMHNSVNERTHIVAGKLISYGIDLDFIHYNLFRRKTYVELMLLAETLKNLELFCDRKIAITYLTQKNLKKYGANENAFVGIVNMITNLEESEVGIAMTEMNDNSFKISLRTKGNVDVSKIAVRFGGGGHKMASGCRIYGKLNNVIKSLVKVVSEYL